MRLASVWTAFLLVFDEHDTRPTRKPNACTQNASDPGESRVQRESLQRRRQRVIRFDPVMVMYYH